MPIDTDQALLAATPSPLGLDLKRRREAAGLSQRALGKAANIPHALISQLESGVQQSTGLETLRGLASPLGCTLAELLGEAAPAPSVGTITLLLPLAQLFASPLNPRKSFPPDAIAELAASIQASGLLQPLSGRSAAEAGWEIFIGGRRLLALQRLAETGDWPEEHLPGRLVPVILRDIGDLDILKAAIAENVNRADMSPIEEGNAFSLLVAGGTTTADIARLYGKGQRWVQERIRVATNLTPEARDALIAGQITMDTARALARTDKENQLRHLDSAKEAAFSANSIRSIVFRDLPLVPLAIFDVRLYAEAGGEVIEGEDGEYARFADIGLFRRLQTEAIEARLAELRESWSWVKRVDDEYWQPFSNGYHQHFSLAHPGFQGVEVS